MDITVKRNAYGRQLGSFHTKSTIKEIGDDIHMVFIRAPYIESVGDKVEVLSVVDKNIVAAKEDNMFVTSFHPELTEDNRVHKYFVDMVKNNI
ncbi:Pyridoxal 5'-phosphate synthase subunit PdxT [bioreactor metagenome]|uniref:Pyridoxal 5'-phosphate synthase subunit PdxT n=1 Tax=bioreactor metagenome TaxID=1076179 RepID=A0A645DP35_9ZZZZ